ncbi:MAG TPA: hypothetical protein VEF90_00330 [Xanthobacteraceae bacterium]|nr:hypothetical protein [Xanthobacteraceae bacterium]
MVTTRTVAAALAIAALLSLGAADGLAQTPRSKPYAPPHYLWCNGAPPEYDPRDLNQMRASVSAASRLALAVREREFFASCRPALRRHRHHVG